MSLSIWNVKLYAPRYGPYKDHDYGPIVAVSEEDAVGMMLKRHHAADNDCTLAYLKTHMVAEQITTQKEKTK